MCVIFFNFILFSKPSPEVSCHCGYGGHLKMAECLAARLTRQEGQILLLTQEISALRDGLSRGVDAVGAVRVSPELESLRSENEKLRYRLLHLRRGLQSELELEKAQGKRRQELKSVEKNDSKMQHINNMIDNKVVTHSWLFLV